MKVYIRTSKQRIGFCPNEFWLLPLVLVLIVLVAMLAGGGPGTPTASKSDVHEPHGADFTHWVMP